MRRRPRPPSADAVRESAQQALNGRYPEKVAWVAGEERSTEFTYDIGTEDIATREVSPTDLEPHESLRIVQYGPNVPSRRDVDLPGHYGFTVNSRGLQILPDTQLGPRATRAPGASSDLQPEAGNSVRPKVQPKRNRQAPPQPDDRSLTDNADQARRALYDRLQPRPNSNRQKPASQGPLGGKPKRQSRKGKAKGHWFLRGRERG